MRVCVIIVCVRTCVCYNCVRVCVIIVCVRTCVCYNCVRACVTIVCVRTCVCYNCVRACVTIVCVLAIRVSALCSAVEPAALLAHSVPVPGAFCSSLSTMPMCTGFVSVAAGLLRAGPAVGRVSRLCNFRLRGRLRRYRRQRAAGARERSWVLRLAARDQAAQVAMSSPGR